ncbi:Gas vesicle protein [Halogranum amylolyticum]|uniref:Gas vesicle protein n=1 Tax=Halogranum amylolyticum TaxID=660520 RepID=A0A1H8P3F6_9EURY|nr:gas vesicle protein [Halogranum amylolyticum]SEO36148.1 Gas vesicle protein [Halogranum amylolyticum]
MTNGTAPTREKDSLADVVEMLLDKGVVINADIAVSVGQTELLGIKLRAAIASFETASQYGLEFPEGTDMERVEEASQRRDLRKPPERGLSTRVGTVDPEEEEETTDEETVVETGTDADASDEAESPDDGTDADEVEDDETTDERAAEQTTETDGTDDR